MSRYFIDFDGSPPDGEGADYASLDDARNAAIAGLGARLQADPSYALNRHWRVDVRDADHRLLLHVIVATVEAPRPLNRESYDPIVPRA
jgi:hypothetical protein